MQKYEYFQTGMSENGIIHITMMKNWVSLILFLRKRGLIVHLAALKKGALGPHIRTMSYIGSTPPPPPPPSLGLGFVLPLRAHNVCHCAT